MVPATPVADPRVIKFILSSQVKLLLVVVVSVALLNKILFAAPTTLVANDAVTAYDADAAFKIYEAVTALAALFANEALVAVAAKVEYDAEEALFANAEAVAYEALTAYDAEAANCIYEAVTALAA
jgi:hypothetical protein